MEWMKSSLRSVLVVLAIGIVAIFLRLYKLDAFPPGLYPDEAVNGNNAIEALSHRDFRIFYPENNGREGLFINIQALSIAAFGNTPFALRVVSALFGILTVMGMYVLAKELPTPIGGPSRRTLGLLASFLMATSFWHVNFSRIGFRAISAPFFLVFGFYFLFTSLNALRQEASSKAARTRSILFAIFSGFFFGLGFYTYIAYRFLPVLLAAMCFISWRASEPQNRKQLLIVFGWVLLATALTALPLGIYFLSHPEDFFGRALQVSVFRVRWQDIVFNVGKTLGMFTFVGDYNWRHNYSGWPLLSPLAGIPFLVGFVVVGTRALRTRFRDASAAFVFLWFLVMLGANFLSLEGSPHALRALPAAPAVFLLAAIGGISIWERLSAPWSPRIRAAAGGLLLFVIAIAGWYEYFILWAPNPETAAAFSANYVSQARLLAALPAETPKYVVANGGGIPVRGLPASAQTLIFLLGGWDEARWKVQNVRIVHERDWERFTPQNSAMILLMQDLPEWRQKIYARFPDATEVSYGHITAFRIP
jgi:4-amino-4-deoxy-L-arabinose transferase-like glycosyltransferase